MTPTFCLPPFTYIHHIHRHWRDLNPSKPGGQPPSEWTSDAWETFLLLGAPGYNEPHLLPIMAAGRGGTSGPPNRAATKQRAREAAQEKAAKRRSVTPAVVELPAGTQPGSGDDFEIVGNRTPSVGTPESSLFDIGDGGELAAFHGTMRAVKEGIEQQTAILKEFAASERKRLLLKESSKKLEELKVQLQYLPPSSPGYIRAIAELEAMASARGGV